MRAAVGGDEADDHVEARRLAGAVRARAARPPRRSRRRATRRARPCAPCSASAARDARSWLTRSLAPELTSAAAGASSPDGASVSGGAAFASRRLGRALAGQRVALRLERCRARGRCGRRRPAAGVRRRAALGLEQLGRRVVRDVVAADLVGAALQDRVVEELELLLRAVVLGALRLAFVVVVGVVALLAERERIAERGGRQRVVGVLLEVDAVRADRERALRDDDVAGRARRCASRS